MTDLTEAEKAAIAPALTAIRAYVLERGVLTTVAVAEYRAVELELVLLAHRNRFPFPGGLALERLYELEAALAALREG